MTQRSKSGTLVTYNDATTGLFKNNTSKDIGADDVRAFVQDLTDSVPFTTDDSYSWTKGNRAGVTSPASLKDIVTVGMSFGVQIQFTDSTASNVVRIYELTNETTAESSPTVIRPNDYAGTTNEKVWRLRATIDVDSDAPGGAVDSVNGQTGVVSLDADDVGADPAGTAAALLTGTISDSDTTHAPTGNAVFDALALKAPLDSPTFTGIPAGPTAAPGTNTTQFATTAFVGQSVSNFGSILYLYNNFI
jgi:hypothetical protein